MKSEDQTTDTSEFIENPSPASEALVEVVSKISQKNDSLFKTKNPLKQLQRELKIQLYKKDGYKDFYKFLSEYKLPETKDVKPEKSLANLLTSFEALYDKLLFNNYALTTLFVKKQQSDHSVATVEDNKILAFKQLAQNKITTKEFKQNFGHYALEPYELSAKRFSEYSARELKKLAQLSLSVTTKKKQTLAKAILNPKANKAATLISIRELAKDRAVQIVAGMRAVLLVVSEESKNVFDKPLNLLREPITE